MSKGTSDRKSINSADIPCVARRSAASLTSIITPPDPTIVRSVPRRSTCATPNGTVKSASTGTTPRVEYSSRYSKNRTGSSQRIAVLRSPLASAGVEGTTTRSPGTWTNQDSRAWEPCAPMFIDNPQGSRMTRGTRAWPPVIYRIFAAWLTISSIAHVARSANMISGTGLSPVIAAPTEKPIIADSLIGVARIWFGNRSIIPAVVPHTDPIVTSSPKTKTRSSRSISSKSASRIASRNVIGARGSRPGLVVIGNVI